MSKYYMSIVIIEIIVNNNCSTDTNNVRLRTGL